MELALGSAVPIRVVESGNIYVEYSKADATAGATFLT
jgi:hypothetical protein